MLVALDSLLDEVLVKTELVLHLLDQLLINGEFLSMKRKIVILGLVELEEWVSSKTFDVDAVRGVSHENLGDDVLRVG